MARGSPPFAGGVVPPGAPLLVGVGGAAAGVVLPAVACPPVEPPELPAAGVVPAAPGGLLPPDAVPPVPADVATGDGAPLGLVAFPAGAVGALAVGTVGRVGLGAGEGVAFARAGLNGGENGND